MIRSGMLSERECVIIVTTDWCYQKGNMLN